jgi:hypothetical protein
VRCITSLRILEGILGQVRQQIIVRDRKDPLLDRDDTPIRPCDHFDVIGGSEWGGILALMFGRLGMVSPWPSILDYLSPTPCIIHLIELDYSSVLRMV